MDLQTLLQLVSDRIAELNSELAAFTAAQQVLQGQEGPQLAALTKANATISDLQAQVASLQATPAEDAPQELTPQ